LSLLEDVVAAGKLLAHQKQKDVERGHTMRCGGRGSEGPRYPLGDWL
jgi:hypothetical protein